MSSLDSIGLSPRTDLKKFDELIANFKSEISKYLIGNNDSLELILAAMISGGHILIEGVPGIAKTLMAKLVAYSLEIDFKRIQFTPDLMPSDITGTSVFNPKSLEFELVRGPVFSNIVLADEINRAPAKSQAALFEVMEEKQVTIDGITHKLNSPFIVIATQNPIEQEGTYRLPEAQIDRFLFKILVDYPTADEELSILNLKNSNSELDSFSNIVKVLKSSDIEYLKEIAFTCAISDTLLKYITEIVRSTRNHKFIYLGASPRASIAILNSSKVIATLRGRDFVTPEDIIYVSYPALRHRIILTPDKEMEGVTPDDVIKMIISSIEVPR